uniref:GDSL esterase/lipase n=1 Tax=Hordeum vulgare subsp. vulgare TaxID=112509 RepID=A0A8I7BFR7_HORVV
MDGMRSSGRMDACTDGRRPSVHPSPGQTRSTHVSVDPPGRPFKYRPIGHRHPHTKTYLSHPCLLLATTATVRACSSGHGEEHCSALLRPRRRRVRLDGGGGGRREWGAAGERRVRVRRLAGGRGQQRLPAGAGAQGEPAVRHGPPRQAHRPLHQRLQPRRRHLTTSGFRDEPQAVPLHAAARQDLTRPLQDWRQLRFRWIRHPRHHAFMTLQGKGTLTMRTQVQYFKKAADNMICYPSKEEHLARSLFLLSGGGNDFSAFDPSTASPQAYVVKMVTTYIEHIQALYDMGARMVGILDVPPIGCTPGQRAGMPNGECNQQANSLAQAFNGLLKAKLAEAAAATMKELKYSVAANYNILNEMMDNSLVAGLRHVKTACCGSGKLNAEVMCSHPGTTACPAADHDDYMFWDMLHPTHATIQRGVVAFFYGNGPKYGEPVNFATLVTGKNESPAIKMVVADE